MVTIKDIARESGYSVSTVSRVLNNRNDVSPDARKKIEEVVASFNFVPNNNAKHLKQNITDRWYMQKAYFLTFSFQGDRRTGQRYLKYAFCQYRGGNPAHDRENGIYAGRVLSGRGCR